MRILRLLLARARSATLLLPLLGCGYPKPSSKEVVGALAASSTFGTPFTISIPSFIDAQTASSVGGGTLDDVQLSMLDAPVGVLHAHHLIDVRDTYGPSSGGGYRHLLAIAPAADAPAALFEPDTVPYPDVDPYRMNAVRKKAGWRVALASRTVSAVDKVVAHDSPEAERLSPGYVLARFGFRYAPTEIGQHFDVAAGAFDQFPAVMQTRLEEDFSIDSRRTEGGRAWLTRGADGAWKVTLFDCPRCTIR